MRFATSLKKRLYLHQVDIIITFLNSQLGKRIYIEQQLYYNDRNKNQVLFLNQRLYKLKQVVHMWFDSVHDETIRLEILQSFYNIIFHFNC